MFSFSLRIADSTGFEVREGIMFTHRGSTQLMVQFQPQVVGGVPFVYAQVQSREAIGDRTSLMNTLTG